MQFPEAQRTQYAPASGGLERPLQFTRGTSHSVTWAPFLPHQTLLWSPSKSEHDLSRSSVCHRLSEVSIVPWATQEHNPYCVSLLTRRFPAPVNSSMRKLFSPDFKLRSFVFLALLRCYPFRVICNQFAPFSLWPLPQLIFSPGLQAFLSAFPA